MKYLILTFFFAFFSSCNKEQGQVEIVSDSQAVLSFSPASMNFGQTVIATTKEMTININHSGDFAAQSINFPEFPKGSPFKFKGGNYPGVGGTCSNELSGSSTCSIVVEYFPTVEEESILNINLKYLDGINDKILILPIYGISGTLPFLSTSESSNSQFGRVDPGATSTRVVTIENSGSLDVVINNIDLDISSDDKINFKGGSFPGTGGTCGATINGNTSCSLAFEFAPEAVQSSFTLTHNAKLYLEHDYGTYTLSLRGTSGYSIAQLAFTNVGSLIFDDTPYQGGISKETTTITNIGFAGASGLTFDFEDASNFSVDSTTCTGTIDVGQACQVVFAFNPIINGTFNSKEANVNYNNSMNNSVTTTYLTGEAIKPPDFKFNDMDNGFAEITSVDFGTIGAKGVVQRRISVENTGDVAAVLKPSTFSLNDDIQFKVDSDIGCAKIFPRGRCNFTISYRPDSLSTPTHDSNFIVAYEIEGNEGTTLTKSYAVTGVSIALPVVSMVSGVYSFIDGDNFILGEIPVDLTPLTQKTIEFENTGLEDALNFSLNTAFIASPYSLVSTTCPEFPVTTTLVVGASCNAVLEYEPLISSSGDSTAIEVDFDESIGVPVTHRLGINAVAKLKAILKLKDDTNLLDEVNHVTSFNFGAISKNNAVTKKFYFKNIGEFNATAITSTITGDTEVSYNSGEFPGLDSDINCSTSLGEDNFCEVEIKFYSSSNGVKNSNLEIVYFDSIETVTQSIPIVGEGADLPFIKTPTINANTNELLLGEPAGGHHIQKAWFTNSGQVATTNLNFDTSSLGIGLDLEELTCTNVLNPGSSCFIRFRSTHFANLPVKISSFQVTTNSQTLDYGLRSFVRLPGVIYVNNLTSTNPEIFDMEEVNFGKQIVKRINISNSGSYWLDIASLTSSNADFIIGGNTCIGSIANNGSCFIDMVFNPTNSLNIGSTQESTISFTYGDGVSTGGVYDSFQKDIKVSGYIRAPLAFHSGWSDIIATGKSVEYGSGNTIEASKVKLSWNAMTIDGGSAIDKYLIYRRDDSQEEYDMSTPLASTGDDTTLTYTDYTAVSKKEYFYKVVPQVFNSPAEILESYAELRIIAPPDNMALVKRRIVNRDQCARLNRVSDIDNFNRCTFEGMGNVVDELIPTPNNKFYDISKDFLVDRFEFGQSGTNAPGQLPWKSSTQSNASIRCANSPAIFIAGIEGIHTKKLLSRKEYMAASEWSPSIVVNNVENGEINSNDCNAFVGTWGDQGAIPIDLRLENTGDNINCVSKFGIFDMVGNVWEWNSDVLINNSGLSVNEDGRIDDLNHDLDDYNFSSHTEQNITSYECLNIALGIPVSKPGATCLDVDWIDPTTTSILDDYFSPSLFTGTTGIISGGNNVSFSTYNYKAGRYSSGIFLSDLPFGGLRCSMDIPNEESNP